MSALQIVHKDGHTYIKATDGSVAVAMQCINMEGNRPKVIGNCIYNEICGPGAVGQGVDTCLRWRRKTQKPNRDARQATLFR